jgi:hypothetical protein
MGLVSNIANKTCVLLWDANQLGTFAQGNFLATKKQKGNEIFHLGNQCSSATIRIAERIWPCICYQLTQAVDLRILSAKVY